MHRNHILNIKHLSPETSPDSEHRYIQTDCQILENSPMVIAFDSAAQNVQDRSTELFTQISGIFAHLMYTQNIVFVLHWDATPPQMVRNDYFPEQRVALLNLLDKQNFPEIVCDGKNYALLIALWF